MVTFCGEKFESLTQRQREILQLLAEGNTSVEVAAILGITGDTVASHVHEIKERLGARSLIQAFVIAMGM